MAEKVEEHAGVVRSAESFSDDFHKCLLEKAEGNLVSSALSAYLVLAMTAYGADGATAEEMRRALHLPAEDAQAHQGFRGFIDGLNNLPNVILKVANKIYASKNITIKDKFKEITGTFFNSESSTLDFSKSAEAIKEVNKWCAERTNNKIQEILSPGDVNAGTGMLLLNAVYFKGEWKHKFHESMTNMKPFHLNKTTTIDVPTMHITKSFFYRDLKDLKAQCIALPYQNEDLYMVIIVPNDIDGLPELEKKMDKFKLDFEDVKRQALKVELALPKFKIESTIDLNVHLNEMGMKEMFDVKANFTGISDTRLKVDKVRQKAFIEVNEEGSEAAAFTGIVCMTMSIPLPPLKVNVDKQFLYRIIYKDTVLFSGRVVNPLKQ